MGLKDIKTVVMSKKVGKNGIGDNDGKPNSYSNSSYNANKKNTNDSIKTTMTLFLLQFPSLQHLDAHSLQRRHFDEHGQVRRQIPSQLFFGHDLQMIPIFIVVSLADILHISILASPSP